MKKPGRNDPCHCGSGKKFKKCCESTMIRGRYVATRLSESPSLQGRVQGLGALFQSHVIPPQPVRLPEIQPETVEADQVISSGEIAETLENKGDILVSS